MLQRSIFVKRAAWCADEATMPSASSVQRISLTGSKGHYPTANQPGTRQRT